MKRFAKLAIIIALAMPVSVKAQKSQTVLWEISGKGLTKKSYLFGTMHTASHSVFTNFPGLIKLMQSSDFGIFEIKGEEIGHPTPNQIEHEPPLDSLFNPHDYALVDSFFTASPLGSIKPHNNDASVAAMLQYAMMLKRTNNKQVIPLDDSIHQIMSDLHKKIYELDDENDSSKHEFNKYYMVFASTLVKLINRNDKQALDKDNEYEKSLTMQWPQSKYKYIAGMSVKRNLIWLPKIITQINKGSCFIAVGAGHLPYKTGVIQLLKQKGYTLKPIYLKSAALKS